MSKVLSVVIPTYNMEALLARCLDSFIVDDIYMDQLEVIIVNDGSKDRSSAIAHEYENRYPQTFKVIDKVNGNYGSCVNRGLKEANGKYFKICDADDRYDTESLQEFIPFLAAAQSDIVFSPYKTLDFESNEKSALAPAERYLNQTLNIENVDWQSPEIVGYRAMHAMCIRTAILKKNNYKQTEGISYTDTEFVFYSVLYSRTCSFFNRPIYLYYLGRDGQTMSPASMVKSHMHFYIIAKKLLDDYVKLPEDIGKEKQRLLYRTVRACASPFVTVSLLRIRDNKKQLTLIDELIQESHKSSLSCPLEEDFLKERYYRAWRKYHIPSDIMQAWMKFRKR